MPGPGPRMAMGKPKNAKKTISRILSYLRPYRARLVLVAAGILLSALAGVAGTYMLRPILNEYIVPFAATGSAELGGFAAMIAALLAIYALGALVSIMIFSLLLAQWMFKDRRINNIAQTVFFTPHLVAGVSAGFIWSWLMSSQSYGLFNSVLNSLGLPSVRWLDDSSTAMLSIIIMNTWKSIGYYSLIIMSSMKSIPTEIYEAARLDNSTGVKTFFKITLPYMMFVMTPYLITQFTGNVNNFNVIFLLSGGAPTPVGNSAGKTDLLVTWLYKLTVDQQYFNLGSVIGIMTFVVLAIVALVTYRNTASYKDEEGFQ